MFSQDLDIIGTGQILYSLITVPFVFEGRKAYYGGIDEEFFV